MKSKKVKKETEGRGNNLPTVSLMVPNFGCGQFWCFFLLILLVASF